MTDIATLAILCGAAAAIAWGVADFFSAKAARAVGPVSATISANVIGAAGFVLFYITGHHGGLNMGAGVWYAAAAGVALGLGQILFFQGLNSGPVSLVSPLASAYPLVTTLGVLVLFHAHLAPRQLIGIATVMLGVFAASELFSLKRSERRLGRGPAFALATAIAWGVGYMLLSQALKTLDWRAVSLIQLCVIAIVCAVFAPAIKGTEKIWVRANLRTFANRFVVGAGLIQMFGMVIINVGIEKDTNFAPVVTAVSACYPVITITLALRQLKEDFKLIPLAGAALTVAGVVVLSLG